MTGKEIIKRLIAEGFKQVRVEGSHHHLKKANNPNVITVPVHGKKDVKMGTLKSIEKKSGVKLRG